MGADEAAVPPVTGTVEVSTALPEQDADEYSA